MENQKYLFTIKVPIEALDDVDARSQTETIKKSVTIGNIPVEYKLQRLFLGKAPEKVNL